MPASHRSTSNLPPPANTSNYLSAPSALPTTQTPKATDHISPCSFGYTLTSRPHSQTIVFL